MLPTVSIQTKHHQGYLAGQTSTLEHLFNASAKAEERRIIQDLVSQPSDRALRRICFDVHFTSLRKEYTCRRRPALVRNSIVVTCILPR